MGALVTLNLADDSPVRDLPWIITVGPLGDDEEWEPVVCGPYERQHALALAEAVVADEELMAVVEPLLPRTSAMEIRAEIAAAKLAVEEPVPIDADRSEPEGAFAGQFDSGSAAEPARGNGAGATPYIGPPVPPVPDEIRAGFARIAARLTTPA